MLYDYEKSAILAFLSDLDHHQQIKKRFKDLQSRFKKEDLQKLITELKGKEIIDSDEEEYLTDRINALFRNELL